MSRTPICINPVASKNLNVGPELKALVDFEAREPFVNEVRPFHLEVEIINKCAGSCLYCYSQSLPDSPGIMPKEQVFNLIDQAAECGLKQLTWCGGDPILHPDWMEIISYCAEKGLMNMLATSSIFSRRQAEQISSLGDAVAALGVHISTIDPKAYSLLYSNPATLELKMQGVRNLIEAGFPAERMWNIMTLSRPAIETFEETVDWFVDEMGIKTICTMVYKWIKAHETLRPEWEPSLQELKGAYEYKAKRLGASWLRIGSGDGSYFFCRTMFGIRCDGTAVPCVGLYELAQGNVFQEGLRNVIDRYGDILLYNHKIKGFCGEECDNRDICFGCRWTAYHYTGDIRASDPKCWLNPEAKEYVFH